jgi:hypothetical protein
VRWNQTIIHMREGVRAVERIGVVQVKEINWHLRAYLMRSDPAEPVDRKALLNDIEAKVRILETEHLSDEFDYLRSGFSITHYGRRGVTLSIWHWADWGQTWEYFSHAWYCYGRETRQMLPLDRREPILSHHELDVVMGEGVGFRNIAARSDRREDLLRDYRNLTIDLSATAPIRASD